MKKGYIILILLILTLLNGCQYDPLYPSKDTLDYNSLNNRGSEYMNQGDPVKAIDLFKEALELNPFQDTAYNNLSWAYYALGEFETSLEYIEHSLKLGSNTSIEYVNYGNALFALDFIDDAIEAYNKAINLDVKSSYAYYGLGTIEFNNNNYEVAEDLFQKALKYNKNDIDSILYIFYCKLYLEDYLEAQTFIDTHLKKHKNNFDLLVAKGALYELTKSEKQVETFYNELASLFPDEIEAHLLIGKYYYYNSNYDKAKTYFENLINLPIADSDTYLWVSYSYLYMADYVKALEYAQLAQEKDPEYYHVYNTIGEIYFEQTKYLEAIPYYEHSISLTNTIQPYTNKLWSLFYALRYEKCIEEAKKYVKLFPNQIEIHNIMALSYFKLYQYEKAIDALKKSQSIDPSDPYIYYYLSQAYYYLGKLEEAKENIDLALQLRSSSGEFIEFSDFINFPNLTPKDQLYLVFKDYYLYGKNNVEEILALYPDTLNNSQIEDVFYATIDPSDLYSFFIYDEWFDYMIKDQKSVHFSEEDNLSIFKITEFTNHTGNEFIKYLDTITNPKDKTLVIDFRDNTGGLTNSANQILNVLLPACIQSQIIYKTGETVPYYSDDIQIAFNKIYILVNENTASASELVTLGLKTYLDNVTILGKPTVGKGVGQFAFEDIINKRIYFIVNHYWNVRENNIMNRNIQPDIIIQSEKLEDYLNYIIK